MHPANVALSRANGPLCVKGCQQNAWPHRRSVTLQFYCRGAAPRKGVFFATLHGCGGKSVAAKSSRGVCALTRMHKCAPHNTVAILAQGTLWADANLQAFCVFGIVLQCCCLFFLVCQRCFRGPMPQPLDDEDLRKTQTFLGCEATRGDAIGLAGRRLASTLHVLCDWTGYRTSWQPMQEIHCPNH